MLTRAGFESVLISRAAGKMKLAGMDSTTKDGTNADLADPIRRAVQSMGVVTSDPVSPADSDLATFTGFAVEKLYDLAHVQLLYNILGRGEDFFDQATGQDQQKLSQVAEQIQADIAKLESRLKEPYGPTLPGSGVAPMTSAPVMPNDPFAWPRGYSRPGWYPYPSPPGPWGHR